MHKNFWLRSIYPRVVYVCIALLLYFYNGYNGCSSTPSLVIQWEYVAGPDNMRHQRVRRLDEYYIGGGATTKERTSQIDYITRGPSFSSFHRPRHERIGEIGWTVNFYNICKGL